MRLRRRGALLAERLLRRPDVGVAQVASERRERHEVGGLGELERLLDLLGGRAVVLPEVEHHDGQRDVGRVAFVAAGRRGVTRGFRRRVRLGLGGLDVRVHRILDDLALRRAAVLRRRDRERLRLRLAERCEVERAVLREEEWQLPALLRRVDAAGLLVERRRDRLRGGVAVQDDALALEGEHLVDVDLPLGGIREITLRGGHRDARLRGDRPDDHLRLSDGDLLPRRLSEGCDDRLLVRGDRVGEEEVPPVQSLQHAPRRAVHLGRLHPTCEEHHPAVVAGHELRRGTVLAGRHGEGERRHRGERRRFVVLRLREQLRRRGVQLVVRAVLVAEEVRLEDVHHAVDRVEPVVADVAPDGAFRGDDRREGRLRTTLLLDGGEAEVHRGRRAVGTAVVRVPRVVRLRRLPRLATLREAGDAPAVERRLVGVDLRDLRELRDGVLARRADQAEGADVHERGRCARHGVRVRRLRLALVRGRVRVGVVGHDVLSFV